jgi:hypothetical protein
MKNLYPYFLALLLGACQNVPQVASPTQDLKTSTAASAQIETTDPQSNELTKEVDTVQTDNAQAEPLLTETVQINVRLDLSKIEPEFHEAIRNGFEGVSLVSTALDGPPLEPIALDNLDDLDKIPFQRRPEPIFSFSQTGSVNDVFTFDKIPKGKDFSLASNRIFIKSEPNCDGAPRLSFASAFHEVKALMEAMQITLSLNMTWEQDLVAFEKTATSGVIRDSRGVPLENASIKIQAIAPGREDNPCFTEVFTTTSDAEGKFEFNNLYAGIQFKIDVTQEGFMPQERVVFLSSNKQGDPETNRFDFTLKQ